MKNPCNDHHADVEIVESRLRNVERFVQELGFEVPTDEEQVAVLDRVRAIVLENSARLNMDYWHRSDDWETRTCAEEAAAEIELYGVRCGTAHCIAGWLQVCGSEPGSKLRLEMDAQGAGTLIAPIAARTFFWDNDPAREWLKRRAYVDELAAVRKYRESLPKAAEEEQ